MILAGKSDIVTLIGFLSSSVKELFLPACCHVGFECWNQGEAGGALGAQFQTLWKGKTDVSLGDQNPLEVEYIYMNFQPLPVTQFMSACIDVSVPLKSQQVVFWR